MVELMAPAGSFEALASAINAGADSIYFGVEQLNMRSRSANFTFEDLPKIVKKCKENNVKTYLTLNTLIYDHDVSMVKKICEEAKTSGVTAVICMDMAAIQIAKEHNLEIHMSTQVNIGNIEAVKFYSGFADVLVLARELTLKQIESICSEIKKQNICGPKGKLIEIEIFVHGALCVAVSGKCYMSLGTYNASANRGACLQNCRRKYTVTDQETGDQLELDNEYIMSPKDLCTITFLDKIIEAGVSVLKVEGRGRSPEYVSIVIEQYKKAIKAIKEGTFSKEKAEKWKVELGKVFNRGFWEGGYYLGKKLGEWSGTYGSKASEEKAFVGTIKHYYTKIGVAECYLNALDLSKGSEVYIIGKTTGTVKTKIKEILLDGVSIDVANKKSTITFKSPLVREGDKLYVIKKK